MNECEQKAKRHTRIRKAGSCFGAEYEREKIRERTSRGRREKARQGYVADGSRGELVVNETEARWVRQAFAWILEGCSTREVAVRLAQSGAASLGLRTISGGSS